MTHAQDVARAQQPIPTRRRDWTDVLMAERMTAQSKAKRQRDLAIEARNRAIRNQWLPEQVEQLVAAVRLAEIELMGAVDATNAAWATVEAERDGFVLVGATP